MPTEPPAPGAIHHRDLFADDFLLVQQLRDGAAEQIDAAARCERDDELDVAVGIVGGQRARFGRVGCAQGGARECKRAPGNLHERAAAAVARESV